MHQVLLLCFFILLVFFTFSFRRIKKVDKHDQVLFPFCQLRRDIMRHLLDNLDTLTPEEYRPLRKLLDMLDATIHNYNRHKTRMFNLRTILRQTTRYRRAKKQAERVDIPEDSPAVEFYFRFFHLLAKAFLAYTPLLRWELAWRLAWFFIGKSFRARINYLRKVAEQIREDARRLNVGGRLQPA